MLAIRLRRNGSRNAPFYRIVVSDSRRTPKGQVVEEIGHYNPGKEPRELTLDRERAQYWIGRGAKLSDTVQDLMREKK